MGVGEYEREGIGPAPDPDSVLAFEIALRLHAERLRVRPRLVLVPSPAAGADWSVDVPAGTTWYVQTIRARWVTSGAAGTRIAQLTVKTADATYFTIPAANSVAAGVTVRYGWMRLFPLTANVGGIGERVVSWPDIPIPGGLTIASTTDQIDAGDQWSNIALYVIEVRERQYQERADAFRRIAQGAHVDNYPGLLLGL